PPPRKKKSRNIKHKKINRFRVALAAEFARKKRETPPRPLTNNIASSGDCHEASFSFEVPCRSRIWSRWLLPTAFLWSIFAPLMLLTLGGYRKKGAMSQSRQRLLPIARQPLALVGVLRAVCAAANDRLAASAQQPGVRRSLTRLAVYAEILRRTIERWKRGAGAEGEPVSGALVKISEGSRALMTLPERGRALVNLVPAPVQVELRKISS